MKKNKFLIFILILICISCVNVDRVFAQCTDYISKNDCQNNNCVWNNEGAGFCSLNGLTYLSCGDRDATDIPSIAPELTSYAVILLKTVAPIVLIIMSIISLAKAITAGKEDEIKKAQSSLIKRIIYAVFTFFIISIVQFIMLRVAHSSEKRGLSDCLACFLNGTEDCDSIYYKDGYGKCYYVDQSGNFNCE